MGYIYKQIFSRDSGLLKQLLKVFGEAFNEPGTYQEAIPKDAYLEALLSKPHFIAVVAMHENKVVGGLTAYELEKFEQDRREIFIYDLAVAAIHRRKGLATKLINELKRIAKTRGAYIIFVQADKSDTPAIKLYESLGEKEDTYNFDILVGQ